MINHGYFIVVSDAESALVSKLERVPGSSFPGRDAPFKLLDDAARAIHQVKPFGSPSLPSGFRPSRADEEQLVSDFIGAMLQLNLSLPPDPKAKFAPASLEDSAKEVILGWDSSMEGPAGSEGVLAYRETPSRVAPAELPRCHGSCLKAQSACAGMLPLLCTFWAWTYPSCSRRRSKAALHAGARDRSRGRCYWLKTFCIEAERPNRPLLWASERCMGIAEFESRWGNRHRIGTVGSSF
eukprot:s705_g16.t1